jgi:hypothetical protein
MKKQLTISQLKKRMRKGIQYKDIHIIVTSSYSLSDVDKSTEIVGILSPQELEIFDNDVDVDSQSEMGFYAIAKTQEIADLYEEKSLGDFQKFMIDLELKKEVLK